MGEGAQGTGSHSPQEPAMCLNKCHSLASHTVTRQFAGTEYPCILSGDSLWVSAQASGLREQEPGPFPVHDSIVCFI